MPGSSFYGIFSGVPTGPDDKQDSESGQRQPGDRGNRAVKKLDVMFALVDDNPAQRAVRFMNFGGLAVNGRVPAGEVCVGENNHSATGHFHVDTDAVRVCRWRDLRGFRSGTGFENWRLRKKQRFDSRLKREGIQAQADVVITGGLSRGVHNPGARKRRGIAIDVESAGAVGEALQIRARRRSADIVINAEQVLHAWLVALEFEKIGRGAGGETAESFNAVPVAEVIGNVGVGDFDTDRLRLGSQIGGDVVVMEKAVKVSGARWRRRRVERWSGRSGRGNSSPNESDFGR